MLIKIYQTNRNLTAFITSLFWTIYFYFFKINVFGWIFAEQVNNFNLVLINSCMSESNIKSSLVYKIRQERQKRSSNHLDNMQSSKNKINFYLTYEEFYKPNNDKDVDESKLKIKERLQPLKKNTSGQKQRKTFHHAKKISLNFDLFNPKRRAKEETQDNNKTNYEEMFMHSKEKYFQKIQLIKRKKSQKCKNITMFGLNIKTVDQTDEKLVIKRESKTKQTISQQNSLKNIRLENSVKVNKEVKAESKNLLTHHRQRRDNPQERSKSFALGSSLKQTSHIKLKMFKMINSNNIVLQSYGVCLTQNNPETRYKYFVGNGNNRNLIKSIMKQRWWWVETNDVLSANFVWTQLKHQPTIQRQQSWNDASQDKKTISSSAAEEDQPDNHKFSFFHEKLNKRLKFLATQREKKSLLKPFSIPECVHNHFSHNYMFGNKNALFQNLTAYYDYKKEDVYSIIPLTFFIEDVNSPKFDDFMKVAAQMKNSIWIVKPGQNSNRGNGIFVSKSAQEIKRKINRRKNTHTYIIQKYITNLMLYHRRKFDIRTYLLMLTIGGVTKYFWYQQGYLRTSSEIFDLRDLTDFFIHLTNDAIQKKCDNYGKFQNGNKIAYSEFQRYLQNTFPQKSYLVKELNEEMKRIARIAVNSCYNKLDPQGKAYGFELFGLDFIVDSNFKPWLIEINTNPCLQLSSPTLQRIIPRMMQNLFRISLDPVFQGSDNIPRSRSYYIYDNCLQKNKFQLIFDSLFDRDFQWQSISQRSAQKVYSQDIEVFQGDGVEVSAIY